MSYCTLQDLIERFSESELIQLTDRTNTGAVNETTVTRAIADSDAEIDSYLQTRYVLPLPSLPQILKSTASDITRYRLYDDRASEQVTKRYTDAVAWLRLVAARKVSLGLPELQASEAVSSGGPKISAEPRTFTRDSLSGYTRE